MANVTDGMSRELVTGGEHDTLGTVARAMRHDNIGSAIVVDDREPAGIVADRDTPGSWMTTRELVTIEADAEHGEVRAPMRQHTVRHLAGVEDGRVVGMVSIRDVVG